MNCGQTHAKAFRQNAPGFTLLELLLVITIIAALAAMSLPHMGGMTKANNMSVATRQMLDDLALARQKALATRSSVYVLFLSDTFPNDFDPAIREPNMQKYTRLLRFRQNESQRVDDLVHNELRAYALFSPRTVGDQPGQDHPKYLTEWKTLPQGILIPASKFRPDTLVTNFIPNVGVVNFPIAEFRFPSADSPETFALRYIKFNAKGQMDSESDEYIPLTSGSVLVSGMVGEPIITETPPGAWTNNFNLIAVDALTGRAKLVRKELP